jgi:hypothetical protein
VQFKELTALEIEKACGKPTEVRFSTPKRNINELCVWERGPITLTVVLNVSGDKLVPMQVWWYDHSKIKDEK